VAGLDTKYIMNTTKSFRFPTQGQAYTNSFYKPIGQPKIAVDFYLYPNLAGPVTISGSWQVFLWVNSSAYKPATFNLQFKEVTLGGAVLWDSGQLSPVVTSSIGNYINVPVYSYNMTTPLTHAFSMGTTFLVEVTVNAGSSADTRIWYDSPLYPSKVILPVHDYARPAYVKTLNANRTETSVFSVFWSESQRKVIIQANVTDPFGGYDIYMVNATLRNPKGEATLSSVNMIRTTDSASGIRYSNLYETTWFYPPTASAGTYTIQVSVIDNNGYYHMLSYGVFYPYIEHSLRTFSIGQTYQVLIRTVDSHNQTLAGAEVQAISSGVILARGYTNTSGWWKGGLWAGYYNLTAHWYGVEVAKQLIQVTAEASFMVRCRVYNTSFKFIDDANEPLPEAEVYVKSPNGSITVPPFFTGTEGSINLTQAPAGSYLLTALWKSVPVQEVTVSVDSDGPYTVKTRVYKLTIKVVGNNEAPVQGAYVIVYTQSGVGFGLEISNTTGQTSFKLPEGKYRIDVRFSTVYWLTAVTTSTTKPLFTVNSSQPLTVTLADYPPPIWTTTGFILIAAASIAVIMIVLIILRRR